MFLRFYERLLACLLIFDSSSFYSPSCYRTTPISPSSSSSGMLGLQCELPSQVQLGLKHFFCAHFPLHPTCFLSLRAHKGHNIPPSPTILPSTPNVLPTLKLKPSFSLIIMDHLVFHDHLGPYPERARVI